jgi:hypothetical protein
VSPAKTRTPADEVAAADAELLAAEQAAADAEQAAEALAEQVRDGDDDVTPEQLDTVQKAGMFARLRAEAAQRKARKAAERAEQARVTALTEQAVTLLDTQANPADIAKLYETARAANLALAAAVDRHDDAVTEALRLLAEAGAPAMQVEVSVPAADNTMTMAWRHAPASRTSPTVHYTMHGAPTGLSVETGKGRAPIYSGSVLGTLFAQVAAEAKPRTTAGETEFVRRPIVEQAAQHGDQVRAFLAAAEGAAK